MKANKKIISFTFILLFLPSAILAQIYKCTINGKVVYKSEPCQEVESKKRTIHRSGFEFDGWKAGMTISEMKQIARRKQLPVSSGNFTYITSYNKKLLDGEPDQRIYTYKTTLMGKVTSVTLSFTQRSKKLYKIKVTFYVVQLKPEERKYFYESLYSQLSEKYGKAKHVKGEIADKSISGQFANIFFSSLLPDFQKWNQDKENEIILSYTKNYHTMTSYDLVYKDIPLSNTNKKEITYELKQKTHESLSKDGSRL